MILNVLSLNSIRDHDWFKAIKKKNNAGDNLEERVSDHLDLHDRLVVVGIH